MDGEALTEEASKTAVWFNIESAEPIPVMDRFKSSFPLRIELESAMLERKFVRSQQTLSEEEPLLLDNTPKQYLLHWTCVSTIAILGSATF